MKKTIITILVILSIVLLLNNNDDPKVFCSECGERIDITSNEVEYQTNDPLDRSSYDTIYQVYHCENCAYKEGYENGYETFYDMISPYIGEDGLINTDVVLEHLNLYFDADTAYRIYEDMWDDGGIWYDGDFSYAEEKVKKEEIKQLEELLALTREYDNEHKEKYPIYPKK